MNEKRYRDTVDALRREKAELTKKMEALLSQSDKIESRVTEIDSIIEGLLTLVGEVKAVSEPEPPGISDAIRNIFKTKQTHCFMASQMKDELESDGFDMTKYKNPSAVIHNTLKRLVAQEEITVGEDDEGNVLYMWPVSEAETAKRKK